MVVWLHLVERFVPGALAAHPTLTPVSQQPNQAMLRSLARCGKVEQRILEMGFLSAFLGQWCSADMISQLAKATGPWSCSACSQLPSFCEFGSLEPGKHGKELEICSSDSSVCFPCTFVNMWCLLDAFVQKAGLMLLVAVKYCKTVKQDLLTFANSFGRCWRTRDWWCDVMWHSADQGVAICCSSPGKSPRRQTTPCWKAGLHRVSKPIAVPQRPTGCQLQCGRGQGHGAGKLFTSKFDVP